MLAYKLHPIPSSTYEVWKHISLAYTPPTHTHTHKIKSHNIWKISMRKSSLKMYNTTFFVCVGGRACMSINRKRYSVGIYAAINSTLSDWIIYLHFQENFTEYVVDYVHSYGETMNTATTLHICIGCAETDIRSFILKTCFGQKEY